MSIENLKLRIEQLSEDFVLSDVDDKDALYRMHGLLDEFSVVAADFDLKKGVAAATDAAKMIENLLFDSVEDVDALMTNIGEKISRVQSELREIEFPSAPASEVVEKEIVETDVEEPEQLAVPEEEASEEVEAEPQVEAEEVEQAELQEELETATPSVRAMSLPENVDMDIFSEFLSRQGAVMDDLEEGILNFEQSGNSSELVGVKRIIHTIKGESGLLGLYDVQKLCHSTETLLEESPQPGIVDTLLAVKDWLTRAFVAYEGKGPPPGPADVLFELLMSVHMEGETSPVETPVASEVEQPQAIIEEPVEEEVVEAPESIAPQVVEPEVEEAPSGTASVLQDNDVDLLNDFINEANEHLDSVEIHMLTLENKPDDETSLNAVFRAFHTIKGVAGYLSLDQIGELAHVVENLLDKARKGSIILEGPTIDVIFESVDMMKRLVDNVRAAMIEDAPLPVISSVADLIARIGVLVGGGEYVAPPKKESAPPVVTETQEKSEVEKPAAVEAPAPAPVNEEKEESTAAQQKGSDQKVVKVRESIKVDADRLDRLVDTIGELVITESMVSQKIKDAHISSQFMGILSQLDKITRQLQEMSTSLRMVPVRATFQKMARLVRDLSKKSGKKINFIMSGEDTELDKSVVDKIGDPLVHMIRNAVDHGIESGPQERIEAGKSEIATVELRAFHQGGNIYIEVVDDGRGLNRGKILEKARKNGLIGANEVPPDKELYNLIFAAGFSTAKEVTDVSGRGIGMDVVRRNIESLRGGVDIQTEVGKGSVFAIRLPLTLAIIDGMMVGVGGERYIIPTLSIVRSLRPEREMLSTLREKGKMFSLDGQMIPLFDLNRLFGSGDQASDIETALVVVVENNGLFTGLVVDQLFGQQQIVIKTLGKFLQNIPGIAGSTIMTDGKVALILDIEGIVKLACSEADA